MRIRREEFIALMTFAGSGRPIFVEPFGLMVGVDEAWRRQGATQEEIDLVAFDWDYVDSAWPGGYAGPLGGPEPRVLEETGEYRIELDGLGRRTKLYKSVASIPLPLDYPVKDMAGWLKMKPMFEYRPERVNPGQIEEALRRQREGALVVADIPGSFWGPRDLMGDEALCVAYYDQPELIHDILSTFKDTVLKVFERVTEKLVVDKVSIPEDLAGKSGPLLGPKQVEEFVEPYFRPVFEMFRAGGAKLFDMDSDGNIRPILDLLLGCGLNMIRPVEAAAGMDLVELRAKYGKRLAMLGGINKLALRGTKEDIRRELEYKMQPAVRDSGGIAFGLDHRVPDGVSIENYRYYADLGREILNLPPRDPSRKGWKRPA